MLWGMRPQGTAQQLERRRRQAIRLLKAGKTLSAVARALSASVSSVFRWNETYQRERIARTAAATHSWPPAETLGVPKTPTDYPSFPPYLMA